VTTRGRIFVISAPSGGGKSSLISRVLKRDPGLTLATSHTSRPPRKGERDGREYHFVSHADFLTMRGRGQFVEWVRLHGNLYGTSRKELDSLLKEGRDILLDVDIRGGASVADIYPDSVSIFILPPSLEVLEERLRKRGSEEEEQVQTRLRAARREVKAARRYRYCIVNASLDKAASELEAVVVAERLRLSPSDLRKILGNILSAPD